MNDRESLYKNNLELAYRNQKLNDLYKIALESLKLIANTGETSFVCKHAEKTLEELKKRGDK
jgi:hypothetical protein